MRYRARKGGSHEGGLNTWWVEDTEMLTHVDEAIKNIAKRETEVAATFWGWVHPDPEGAAEAEAKRLNDLNEQVVTDMRGTSMDRNRRSYCPICDRFHATEECPT